MDNSKQRSNVFSSREKLEVSASMLKLDRVRLETIEETIVGCFEILFVNVEDRIIETLYQRDKYTHLCIRPNLALKYEFNCSFDRNNKTKVVH